MNVVTVGCFDCLHEGHANLFREMRKRGDIVVAMLHDDRSIWKLKGRFPVQDAEHRSRNLWACNLVSQVVLVKSTDPSQAIRDYCAYGAWTFMRGDDMPDFPGRGAVESLGMSVVLVPYSQGVSTTERLAECK